VFSGLDWDLTWTDLMVLSSLDPKLLVFNRSSVDGPRVVLYDTFGVSVGGEACSD